MSIELDVINKKLGELNKKKDRFNKHTELVRFAKTGSNIALLKQLLKDIEAKATVERAKLDSEAYAEELAKEIKKINEVNKSFAADRIANEIMKAQAEACLNNSLRTMEAMKDLKLPEVPNISNLLLSLHEDAIRIDNYERETQKYERNSASANYSACDKCVNYSLKDVRVKGINVCCSDPTYNPFEGCGGCYYEMDSFYKNMRELAKVNIKLREDTGLNDHFASQYKEFKKGAELYSQYLKDKTKEQLEASRLIAISALYNLKKPSLYNPFMSRNIADHEINQDTEASLKNAIDVARANCYKQP